MRRGDEKDIINQPYGDEPSSRVWKRQEKRVRVFEKRREDE